MLLRSKHGMDHFLADLRSGTVGRDLAHGRDRRCEEVTLMSRAPHRVGLDRTEVTEDFENPLVPKIGLREDGRFYRKKAGRKEEPVEDRMDRQSYLSGRDGFVMPCKLWTGSLRDGYGSVWYHGRYVRVHRMAFILRGEVLTEGMQIDHLCERKNCWERSHLEEVTPRENKLREIARRTRR